MLNIALTLKEFYIGKALKAFRGAPFRDLGDTFLPLACVGAQPLRLFLLLLTPTLESLRRDKNILIFITP